MFTFPVLYQDIAQDQSTELTLQAGRAELEMVCQFPEVPTAIGMEEQGRKDPVAGPREQSIGNGACTHFA